MQYTVRQLSFAIQPRNGASHFAEVNGENRYKQGIESYNAKDYTSALPFFSHAAYGFDNKEAMKMLGTMYLYGQGADVDVQQAILWYKRAGDAEALYRLGQIYCEGAVGLNKDAKEAIQYFTKAAEEGYADAEFAIGKMYQQGNGVDIDDMEAFHWLFKAANNGHVDAQYQVGLYYESGAMEDKEMALIWFRDAAQGGNEAAQLKLGISYKDGNGVTQDYTEALCWLSQAAVTNHEAMLLIGGMYMNGLGVVCDEDEALKWFQKAYNHTKTREALSYISQVKKQKFNKSRQPVATLSEITGTSLTAVVETVEKPLPSIAPSIPNQPTRMQSEIATSLNANSATVEQVEEVLPPMSLSTPDQHVLSNPAGSKNEPSLQFFNVNNSAKVNHKANTPDTASKPALQFFHI